jgi:hypothetical protein
MASITSWTRLEPRTQRDDLQDSLAARLHDPLWQLARQWQIGEFTAEDAGSPVTARVRLEQSPLTRYRPGPAGTAVPYDARTTPLEALVEREAATPDARSAALAGTHFLRLLEEHGAGRHGAAYTARYALQAPPDEPRLDAAARRMLIVLAGRVPDGRRLHADLARGLPVEPAIPAADRQAVTAAAEAYVAWYESEIAPAVSAPAWQHERVEYAFAVGAPTSTGEVVLAAPEYAEGRVDWATFDRQAGAALGAAADKAAVRSVTRTVIPTPVTYRGMPAARWWEFEDADVDFGRVEAGPTDLLRLMSVSFAVGFGNDWLVAPVELDVGAVYKVRSLVVTDSFGHRTLVRPAAHVDAPRRDWRMFSPTSTASTPDDSAELLVLAPATATSLQGEPVEEVLLLRDEIANLAWGVERVVESATGGRLDRTASPRAAPVAPTTGDGDGLRYRLSTPVPANWVPLVPVRVDPAKTDVRLRRGRVLLDRDGTPTTPPALGRILDASESLDLYEEEVPRAGTRITRAYQYARWSDGTAHVWVGRRKQPGRGEGWSGLRFDVIEPA